MIQGSPLCPLTQLLPLVLNSQFPDVALSSDPTWLHNALGSHLAGKSERSLCRSPSKHSVVFHRLISKPVGMVEECDGQWAYPVPALPLSQGGGD